MTVNTATSTASYAGNGTTQLFPVPFYFLLDADLKVSRKLASTGATSVLTLNSDYTISGAGVPAGGTLSMLAPPAIGDQLFIERNIAFIQQTSYPENNKFPSASHEKALDRDTMGLQQLDSRLSRALIRDPLGSTYDLANSTLINSGTATNANDVPGLAQVQGLIVAGAAPALVGPNGSSLVGYLQAGTGATSRTVQDRLRDTINVFDFFTPSQIASVRVGDLVQDVTTAFQAALTASAGKELYLPAGAYRITAGLIAPPTTFIRGAGNKSTYLFFALPASSSANLVSVNAGSPGGAIYGFGMRDLSLVDQTVTPNTTGVYVEQVINGLFENINAQGMHVGFSFSGGLNRITNGEIAPGGAAASAVGVVADGPGTGVGIYFSIVLSSTVPANQVGVGYLFRNGAAPTMYAANTYGCRVGCHLTATNQTMYWPELVGCQFDTASDTGLLIDTGVGGNVYGGTIENLWCGTMGAYGVHIVKGSGNIDGLTFTGGRILANGNAGFLIEGCSNINISGMLISGNGSSANPGIAVNAAMNGLTVTGCRIGPSSQYGATQNFGISLGAFAITNSVITGNNLSGNIAGGISNLSTAPVTISGNTGDGLNTVIAPTLLNSWVNNGAPTQTAGYWKDSSGIVHIQGVIKSGTVGAAAFTLPAGFRPSNDEYFSCISNALFGYAHVTAAGNVTIDGGSNAYFSLSGISFKAA
jgi:hypothetical protein